MISEQTLERVTVRFPQRPDHDNVESSPVQELFRRHELSIRHAHILADRANKSRETPPPGDIPADIPHMFSIVISNKGKIATGNILVPHATLARAHDLVVSGPHFQTCASGFLFHLRDDEHQTKFAILSNRRVLPGRVIGKLLDSGVQFIVQEGNLHYYALQRNEEYPDVIDEAYLF